MYRSLARTLAAAILLLLTFVGVAPYAVQASEDDSGYGGAQRFSIAVIPDTQYLFDEDRYDPQVLTKTLQWIVDHTREKRFWMVGATQYGRVVGPAMNGWLGDVRIVNRPLSVQEFMISRDRR